MVLGYRWLAGFRYLLIFLEFYEKSFYPISYYFSNMKRYVIFLFLSGTYLMTEIMLAGRNILTDYLNFNYFLIPMKMQLKPVFF